MSRALLIFFIVFLTTNLFSKPIIFDGGNRYINSDVELFITKEDTLTPKKVLEKASFRKANFSEKNFGYVKGALWMKFDVENFTPEEKIFIQIRFPTLDVLTLYKIEEGQIVDTHVMSEWDYQDSRVIKHPMYHFDLNLDKGQKGSYLLKVQSKEQVIVPLKIGTESQFQSSLIATTAMFYVFLGVMIALFIYNLFVFLIVRDLDYIYYLGYILLMALTQFNRHGYASMCLWPNIEWVPNFAMSQLAAIIGLSILPFALRFLQHEWKFDFTSICIAIFGIALCCGVIIGWTGEYTLSRNFSIPATLFGACVLILMSVNNISQGKSKGGTKYFLFAWSSFMFFVAYFVLSLSGVLDYNELAEFSPELGAGLEGVLLSFALANRINDINKEKIESQKVAFDVQEKYKALLSEQNEILEKKVKIKTEELHEANKELKREALSAQINPHFTFNVLNSIQEYILKNERTSAYKYLSKFSKLMRFFLVEFFA